jgi:hypothetical protein
MAQNSTTQSTSPEKNADMPSALKKKSLVFGMGARRNPTDTTLATAPATDRPLFFETDDEPQQATAFDGGVIDQRQGTAQPQPQWNSPELSSSNYAAQAFEPKSQLRRAAATPVAVASPYRPLDPTFSIDVPAGMPVITSVSLDTGYGTGRHSSKRATTRSSPERVSGFPADQSLARDPGLASRVIWRQNASDVEPRRVFDSYASQTAEGYQSILAQKDSEIRTLREENARLMNELNTLETQKAALIERYQSLHESLNRATRHIEQQNIEIHNLKTSLSGEVSDNDQLKYGLLDLIRKANTELTQLRQEVQYRDRKEKYEREFYQQQINRATALQS